jgi:hypothetical protein
MIIKEQEQRAGISKWPRHYYQRAAKKIKALSKIKIKIKKPYPRNKA